MSTTTINSGYIANGITLSDATLTNTSTGTIVGGTLTYAVLGTPGGADTVVNAGSIGASGYGVKLLAGYANRVVVAPGAVFGGTVSGGNTIGSSVVSALELASGSFGGTLSGLGTKYSDFARVTVDAGASWTLNGSNTNFAGTTLTNSGTLIVAASLGNSGSLAGGVTLDAGSSLTNASGATISSSAGVAIYSTATAAGVSVINAGVIYGSSTRSVVGLHDGGYVSNASTGTISSGVGGGFGVYFTGAAGTLVNDGQIIDASRIGVELKLGGSVANDGTIIGGTDRNGIYIAGAAGTVVNSGLIVSGSTAKAAVDLFKGGSLTNQATGTITGGSLNHAAIYTTGASALVVNFGLLNGGASVGLAAGGTVSNYGTIDGTNGGVGGNGVVVLNAGLMGRVGLSLGGSVTNLANGTIDGTPLNSAGIDIGSGGGTVINAGTIIGGTQPAIFLGGTYANRVIVDPGAVFIGDVNGGNMVASTLELASATIAGSLSGLGTKYSDFAQVTVDAGASWTLNGSNTNIAGATLTNSGTLIVATSLGNSGSLAGGVTLDAGSSLTNASGATISSSAGVAIYSTATAAGVSVVNAGVIYGSNTHPVVGLHDGGYVSNASTGTITSGAGDGTAVYFTGAAGTLVNDGRIVTGGSHSGVALEFGGSVDNQGTIIAGANKNGIYATGAASTITNGGLIVSGSTAKAAVDLFKGGSLTNQATGTITGGSLNHAAIYTTGASAVVVNFGLINGGASVGLAAGGTVSNYGTIDGTNGGVGGNGVVVLNAGLMGRVGLPLGGSVTNLANGTIDGTPLNSAGIDIGSGGGTVINAGTIIGGTQPAIFLGGTYANRVVVDPGAVFIGDVNGGNMVASTLELASATIAGSLSGLGAKYSDFAQVTVDPDARWTLTGGNSLAAGVTLINSGTLSLASATLSDASALVNDGAIILDPSTLTVAGITGTGSVTIDSDSTLEVKGTMSSGETLVFAGGGAYLHLGSPDSISGNITNFTVGQTIDLKGINSESVSYAGGRLNFSGGSFALSIAGAGTVTALASLDGATVTVLCFCVNTQILTPSGERPVQELAVGDLVTTWRGEARPIVWIGVGKVLATRGHRSAATPVIVHMGALEDNVPCRDLRVTKGHAFWIDDVLIPVEFLVNHRSIEWDDRAQEVELYHIELAAHDVLVANGAPAESYRDDGNRWLFRNANTGWGLPLLEPCAPVVTGGAVVDTAWRRLLDRAGPRPGVPLTDEPDLYLLVNGDRLETAARHGAAHIFHLPARVASVRIVSRAGVPAELGLARDPRVLGVAVRRIVVRQGSRFRVMEAADALLEEGFHDFEPDNRLRWTNGDAAVPAALFNGFDGTKELVLHIGGATQYQMFCVAGTRAAA